jgi:hypothetical protein
VKKIPSDGNFYPFLVLRIQKKGKLSSTIVDGEEELVQESLREGYELPRRSSRKVPILVAPDKTEKFSPLVISSIRQSNSSTIAYKTKTSLDFKSFQ